MKSDLSDWVGEPPRVNSRWVDVLCWVAGSSLVGFCLGCWAWMVVR